MLNLPAQVEVKELAKTNCKYKGELITLYDKLYEGGASFENVKDMMLVKREQELDNPLLYKLRKDISNYINRAGGMLDFLRAAVFKSEPEIECEPENEYWSGLNENADGLGTPLSTILRDALLSVLLHSRAYLLADFQNELYDPLTEGTNDARMRVLEAGLVDDWEHDEAGKLLWVRLHTAEKIRSESSVVNQPDTILHKWTYIDENEIATYEARSKVEQDIRTCAEMATLTQTKPHEFGCLPVFEVKVQHGQWVMDRLYPVIKSLFNRESALTWQLDRQSFAQLVLTVEDPNRINSVYSSETNAIVLQIGETAGYITPPASASSQSFEDIDRLVKGFYEVISALSINASATQTQNARQSAEAKEMDRDPLQILLASFATPIISALKSWIEAVKEYRNESFLNINVIGMDKFSAKMEEMENVVGRGNEGSRGSEEERTEEETE